MRAVICRKHGDPEVLALEQVPSPEPQKGQVVIAVHASGVNFGDILTVRGRGQGDPPRSFTPGYEVAGAVARIGSDVNGLTPGMRVIAFPWVGGYAEEAVVDQAFVYPIPDSVEFIPAASLLATYGTAHHALIQRANLKAEETLLVLGASGGAGLAAVEIGRLCGARVIAAASTDDKLALCAKSGAHGLINYGKEDLAARLREIAPQGVDVVFDPVGGTFTPLALNATGSGGRYLVVGFAAGDAPQIPSQLLLVKQISAIGIFWGGYMKEHPEDARRTVEEVIKLTAAGRINPHVSKTFPLADAVHAMRHLLARQATGKVILLPR